MRSDLYEDEDDGGNTDVTWPRREAARLRQIGIGKARPEYRRYIAEIAIDQREPEHPRTPDYRARDVSKRQFDRALGDWRRRLHEFAAARDAIADGDIVRGGRSRRAGSGRTAAAPRSDSEDAADGPQWRPKSEMLAQHSFSGSAAPAPALSVSSPRAGQGTASSSAHGSTAVIQISLADQLPQMSSVAPMPGCGQSSSLPMTDGFPWGWTDPQDMHMNWLAPPAEEQMEQVWPWPCDGPNEMIPSPWSPPPEFFETPQKMQHRVPDEWTPPKPDFLMGHEHMPKLWPCEETMDWASHGYQMMTTAPVDMPYVPPLPAGLPEIAGYGTNSPPLTPRGKKERANLMASPALLKTPNTRPAARVPFSAGGGTSLPATPNIPRWYQETPSPHRMYHAEPDQRVSFGEIPASVFPLPETAPWTTS